MQKRPHISFRQTLFAVLVFLAFSLFTIFLFSYRKDEKKFLHLCDALYRQEMCANTLNMHYTIADPKSFGIDHYEPVLPIPETLPGKQDFTHTKELLAELASLHTEKLNTDDRLTKTLLERTLKLSLSLADYPFFEEPLSPEGGMQSQLPILFAEYAFRSKRDVTDYLALLQQTGDYFASLLEFEMQKADAGMLMSKSSLKNLISQCDTIVTKEALDEGNHFLQTTFSERLNTLVRTQTKSEAYGPLSQNPRSKLYSASAKTRFGQKEFLSEKEYAAYLSENNRLLTDVLLPAYQNLKSGLQKLLERAPENPQGLAAYPGGSEYYKLLLLAHSGTYRSPEQAKALLYGKLKNELHTLQTLTKASPQITAEKGNLPVYPNPETMLADLKLCMQADFPAFPISEKTPKLTLKRISPCLQNYCAPAFYLTAPADDYDNNVIYINPKDNSDQLTFFTTLAHEGYPGHLYQTVYHNEQMQINRTSKARQLLWYGGYLEGWALYTEFLSYDYIANRLTAAGNPGAAAVIEAEKHNRSLQLCLYSLLDIMIHYENASEENVCTFLAQFGIDRPDLISEIYRYIADSPCNYPKYYLGYLEILQLKHTAKTKWKERYNDLSFHTYLLNIGPADFLTLTEYLPELPPD